MIEVEIDCPYCGEPVALAIDETGGRAQTYIEDCVVCCKPIEVTARYRRGRVRGHDPNGG